MRSSTSFPETAALAAAGPPAGAPHAASAGSMTPLAKAAPARLSTQRRVATGPSFMAISSQHSLRSPKRSPRLSAYFAAIAASPSSAPAPRGGLLWVLIRHLRRDWRRHLVVV